MSVTLEGLTIEHVPSIDLTNSEYMELNVFFKGTSVNHIINFANGYNYKNHDPVSLKRPDEEQNDSFFLGEATSKIIKGLEVIKFNAVKQWMDEFNTIPTEAVTYLAQDGVETLAGEEVSEYSDWLVAWGEMWTFKHQTDIDWVRTNAAAFENAGISLFDVQRLGYVFGIDGAGYSFLEEHFVPLYESRDLQWHEPWPELDNAVRDLIK